MPAGDLQSLVTKFEQAMPVGALQGALVGGAHRLEFLQVWGGGRGGQKAEFFWGGVGGWRGREGGFAEPLTHNDRGDVGCSFSILFPFWRLTRTP